MTPTDPARGERRIRLRTEPYAAVEEWVPASTADALAEVLRDIVDRELITPTLRHRIQAELTAYDEGSRS